jgi:carboxyl-terminal processing protease
VVAILSGAALFASGFTLGLQQSLSPGTPADEQALFDPFWEAYQAIRAEYVGEYQPEELVQGAISGMFRALDDPYSSYMSPEEYRRSLGGISGEFEGIGAQMEARGADGATCSRLGPDCRLIVVGVLDGSPAQAGGLAAGDEVVAVDGTAVAGLTLDQVVERVKGPKDTDVRLTLRRSGSDRDVTLTRAVIRTQDVHAELLADGTVGYLRVDGFSDGVADDFRARLGEQLDAGVHRLVLDLRDDPGGYVDAALSIASQFIGTGPVYWEEAADGRQTPAEVEGGGLATDPSIRVAVLVNGGSASASEIVAGALQDTGRGTLVGQTTYGKGTIQQWHELAGESGGFRLSVAKWLTPSKRWIHGVGLQPDIPVDPGSGEADAQLERALEVLASEPAPAPSGVARSAPVRAAR